MGRMRSGGGKDGRQGERSEIQPETESRTPDSELKNPEAYVSRNGEQSLLTPEPLTLNPQALKSDTLHPKPPLNPKAQVSSPSIQRVPSSGVPWNAFGGWG